MNWEYKKERWLCLASHGIRQGRLSTPYGNSNILTEEKLLGANRRATCSQKYCFQFRTHGIANKQLQYTKLDMAGLSEKSTFPHNLNGTAKYLPRQIRRTTLSSINQRTHHLYS